MQRYQVFDLFPRRLWKTQLNYQLYKDAYSYKATSNVVLVHEEPL